MLKAYLQSVQAWIERGCPEGAPYSRKCGLCRNVYKFEFGGRIHSSLTLAFHQQKLDITYPFNSSFQDYENECFLLSVWDNPRRLAWVKKHAETLP